MSISPGEILPAGPVINPETAVALGDTVIRMFGECAAQLHYLGGKGSMQFDMSGRDLPGETKVRYGTSVIVPSHDDLVAIDAVNRQCAAVLRSCPDADALDCLLEAFVGTPSHGEWHFDPDKDLLLLVNLSRQPYRLTVADRWTDDDYDMRYGTLRVKKTGPAASTTLRCASGEGILLDNRCAKRDRRPHHGIATHEKVFLRAYTRSTDGEGADNA